VRKLHETIQEKLEEHGGGFLRAVALTTAIFAAVAALSALQAGHTVNEALALKMDAARYETAASDQWAFYQAKGIKGAVAQAGASVWQALGKTPPPELAANAKRYAAEQDSITRIRLVWLLSMLFGVTGLALYVWPFLSH